MEKPMTNKLKYPASVLEYLESVDGAAHMSAVEIIEKLDRSRNELLAALKKLFNQATWLTHDNAKQYYELIKKEEK